MLKGNKFSSLILTVMKYPYKLDYLIIAVVLAIGILGIYTKYKKNKSEKARYLIIQTSEGEKLEFDLKCDTILFINGRLGISVIEISNNSARFLSSPCPNKLCVKHGSIENCNDQLICIPNGVLIKFSSGDDLDALSY